MLQCGATIHSIPPPTVPPARVVLLLFVVVASVEAGGAHVGQMNALPVLTSPMATPPVTKRRTLGDAKIPTRPRTVESQSSSRLNVVVNGTNVAEPGKATVVVFFALTPSKSPSRPTTQLLTSQL